MYGNKTLKDIFAICITYFTIKLAVWPGTAWASLNIELIFKQKQAYFRKF